MITIPSQRLWFFLEGVETVEHLHQVSRQEGVYYGPEADPLVQAQVDQQDNHGYRRHGKAVIQRRIVR